jgi:hypothetical protein
MRERTVSLRDRNLAIMKALEQDAKFIGSFYALLQREGCDADVAGACTIELARKLMDDLDVAAEDQLDAPSKHGAS